MTGRQILSPKSHGKIISTKSQLGFGIEQKSTCLDANDPRAVKLPHPKETNWEDRSYADYNVEDINHPTQLSQNHPVSATGGC